MDRTTFIQRYCGGNEALYEDTMRSAAEAKREAAAAGKPILPNYPGIRWYDIENLTKCYPQYAEEALDIMERYISYLPQPEIYIPHEAFVRALIANYKSSSLSEADFMQQLDAQLKQIRNDDMKKSGWAENKPFSKKDYNYYDLYLPQFKQAARNKLSAFLDYEPLLEHSLDAEVFLRQLFLFENYHEDMWTTSIEYRAATIYQYRKCLLTSGREEADKSSLVGALLYQQTNLTPSFLKK